jgi:hypothetical protein
MVRWIGLENGLSSNFEWREGEDDDERDLAHVVGLTGFQLMSL